MIFMNNEVIKKTTEKRVFLSDKEQHQKVSKIALIMSLIPILSQFIAFFKVHYTVSHIKWTFYGNYSCNCFCGCGLCGKRIEN